MTVCLSMIVKNEASVIRRCLESVRPMIDTWCIVDTGSTDGTQDLIADIFRDIPGVLHQCHWVNFAHNRNEALDLARPLADYTFIMDADDTLEPAPPLPPLTADAYTVGFINAGTRYRRVQVIKNTLPWRYRGVVHEFLECTGHQPAEDLPIEIVCGHDSARSRDPHTYAKDAALLEAAFDAEADPWLKARYGFYLAQSYRDCGKTRLALDMYEWRARQEFWIEEVYVSLLNAARLREILAPETAINLYERAIAAVPTRAEAYHGAARFNRLRVLYEPAYQFAKSGIKCAMPPNGLFVEQWIYDWGLMDEMAISAYWSERYRQSLDANELLLAEGKCPDTARLVVNRNFARRKLVTEFMF